MALVEFGVTAWGRAWLRTVERTTGLPLPGLPKARTLARNRQVALDVAAHPIAATVTDGTRSHTTVLPIRRWDEGHLRRAWEMLRGSASATGDLPDDLAGALKDAGVVVAIPLEEVPYACSCRSRASPCAHVLAAVYALVLLIDERPQTAVDIRTGGAPQEAEPGPDWVALATLSPEGFYSAPGG